MNKPETDPAERTSTTSIVPATQIVFYDPHGAYSRPEDNPARMYLLALAAMLAGGNARAVQRGLDSFAGVRDRMEEVATIMGVTYINDTTATAPVAAAAALSALSGGPGRVHLLAGGADKKLDPTPLAVAAARSGAAVYLFSGTATPALRAALAAQGLDARGDFEGMRDAVTAATGAAQPGDTVLLSPGCASFGLFRDEFDRGEQFRQVVAALTDAQVVAPHD
mgnify:CR=1 FL=1